MDIIKNQEPETSGMYVAYSYDFSLGRYATKRLLTYYDGDWYYPSSDVRFRDKICGWIGPLPALERDSG